MASRGEIFVVVRSRIVRIDLLESLDSAGFPFRVFEGHFAAIEAIRTGAPPRAVIFDTPLDVSTALGLEDELASRGIRFIRLSTQDAADIPQGPETSIVPVPFSMGDLFEELRRQIG